MPRSYSVDGQVGCGFKETKPWFSNQVSELLALIAAKSVLTILSVLPEEEGVTIPAFLKTPALLQEKFHAKLEILFILKMFL